MNFEAMTDGVYWQIQLYYNEKEHDSEQVRFR